MHGYNRHRLDDIRQHVRAVLNNDWDPIGMASLAPEISDEYDNYIDGVISLLYRHATESVIAQHLMHIESEYIGAEPNALRAQGAAATLRALPLPPRS